MSLQHFIPEIWSAQILQNFWQNAIFAGLTNRDYEGDARQGNTVHISGVVNVAIKDYKAAGRTTNADDISDTGVDLPIDQEKSFDFYVDDIDRVQAAGPLDAYTVSAANGLIEDCDQFLAALLVAQGTSVTPGSPATDGKTAWDTIRDLRKALNKAKVPQGSRVLVVNSEFGGLLEENDAKLMSATVSGTTDGLRNAAYGSILGFDVYTSENLPVTDKPQAIAWYQPTLAFADQINNVEGLRATDRFADRVRGLHVYGGKVVKPIGVATYTAA